MKQGQNLLSILNDLKRDVPTAAKELGMSERLLTSYITGDLNIPHSLIKKAAKIWPVNERDFYVFNDDAPEGVFAMTQEQSIQSARVLQRGGIDYYEYRDTAMSRVSLFRPEWIKELVSVEDNDPYSKKIFWNNGHFLHQFTYFIGPVNFYYERDGKRHCAEMNTGDSMYITPYVPHTFATRKNKLEESGLIIAVTYGGKLAGDGQQELAVLGKELTYPFLLDYSSENAACGSLIKMFREQLSMPLNVLASSTTIPLARLILLENGKDKPTEKELKCLANSLYISEKELLPLAHESPVKVLHAGDARWWEYDSSFLITELASPMMQSHLKGFEFIIRSQACLSKMRTLQHQYLYNIGTEPVEVVWTYNGKKSVTINSNDSAYIKPNIEHTYAAKNGKLLVVRIGGRLSGDAQHELSLLDKRGLDRVVGELMPWYDKEGKN